MASFNKTLGRWQVTLPDGRRTYRYRQVMEQHLGRALREDEHVHHMNGDPTDDRLENLQLLTPSEHHKLHAPERAARAAKSRAQAWGPNGENECSVCDTDDRPYLAAGKCGRCYYREKSREYRGGEARKPATVVDLVCEDCGKEFQRTLKQGVHRYCSRGCSSRASATRRWDARRAGREDAIGKRAAA